ncbi:ETX/MTX2 family pore-forming toxin, partial [Bacillus thuringiensis]
MKIYKKIATIAPIAALSTSILCSPAMTFAAESATSHVATASTKNVSAAAKKVDIDTLRDDLHQRMMAVQMHHPEVLGLKSMKELGMAKGPVLAGQTAKVFDAWNPTYSNTKANYDVTANATNVKHDSLDVYTYTNKGLVDQVRQTDEKTYETSNTLTQTHSAGVNAGYSYSAEINVGIPMYGAGKTTHTFKVDADYRYTNTHTTTDKETIKIPSQSLKCVAGYTTKLVMDRATAEFNGTMEYEL